MILEETNLFACEVGGANCQLQSMQNIVKINISTLHYGPEMARISLTGINGNLSPRGGNFAVLKWEFPVALI